LAQSRSVDKAVVLAMDGVVDAQGNLDRAATEMYVPNEYLERETAKYPNLLWGASVNPHRGDALERLAWAKEHRAVLVKWLPAIMQIDPSDPRLVPFYKKLVELDLPLLTHSGDENAFTRVREEYSDPERLRLPASLGVRVIVAHAAAGGSHGGERSADRLMRLMKDYPNVSADISALTQVNRRSYIKEVFTRPEFRGRLVYGTDYPLVGMKPLVSPWWFVRELGWSQARQISRIKNDWDRDVALKRALAKRWASHFSLLASSSFSEVTKPEEAKRIRVASTFT
jgi:predicted TIM-barrel fold metal-dependent hydrolase